FDGTLTLARARDLRHVDARTRDLAPAFDGSLVTSRARALARDLFHARARARGLARTVRYEEQRDPTRRSVGGEPIRISVPARGLAHAAVRMLPAADRSRYAEEFQAELVEISRRGGKQRAQMAYAAAQLRHAPLLRFELREPHRRNAAP